MPGVSNERWRPVAAPARGRERRRPDGGRNEPEKKGDRRTRRCSRPRRHDGIPRYTVQPAGPAAELIVRRRKQRCVMRMVAGAILMLAGGIPGPEGGGGPAAGPA